jgi:uncharacterized repeat protein (TIGR03837 family)
VDNLPMAKLQWDIFCKVVDNFGDLGVSWRLACDLAARGHPVRLWADDISALTWMAPGGYDGVHVMRWGANIDTTCLDDAPCDVMIETFGCDIAPQFIAACARIHSSAAVIGICLSLPVWINLEYLTAETYAERSHGLPSLVQTGPAAGWEKWFFYPGFTEKTGGLLRENDLRERQANFDRDDWLSRWAIDCKGRLLAFLFCYEPPALAMLLRQLKAQGINGQSVTLMVAAGRTAAAVKNLTDQIGLQANECGREQLSNLLHLVYLPELTQRDFDHALWAADLNFVRGEDSLVRAIWAGKPLVWQIYPQADGAHLPKLDALLSLTNAPQSLKDFHHWWNSSAAELHGQVPHIDLEQWRLHAHRLATAQFSASNLTTQLERFVLKNR